MAYFALASYSNAAGPAAEHAPALWPEESALGRISGRATLLMFAHPGCPCTRASLSELAALLRENGESGEDGKRGEVVQAIVVFRHVSGRASEALSKLKDQAAAIPGVVIHLDEQGVESERFDARTSGQTLLYDRKGALLFQGGLTVARGHEGLSPGRLQLAALLRGFDSPSTSKVYGCSLRDPEGTADGAPK